MHIGVDFDNTIVSYDALFHRVAMEQRLIPETLPSSKLAVRDHLRAQGLEQTWTEMQGYVYGVRMKEAAPYPGFVEFTLWARSAGHRVTIISHKTRYPFAGPQYDLHAAAQSWIEMHLRHQSDPLIAHESIYFELTKQEKLARIGALTCDVFIDDLPEILLAETLPSRIRKLLFDPDGSHSADPSSELVSVQSWRHVREALDA